MGMSCIEVGLARVDMCKASRSCTLNPSVLLLCLFDRNQKVTQKKKTPLAGAGLKTRALKS